MTSHVPSSRPELDELALGDPPEAWRRLGFTVDRDGVVALGGVRLRLGAEGQGIVGWRLRGMGDQRDLDGLTACPSDARPPAPAEHPIGATGIDHVVALTPDLDRTVRKFEAVGLDLRRVRDAGDGFRQAFFVLGPCLLELGGPSEGAVRFWGLTLVVDDLDAAAGRLGDRLGRIKDAVQPGRRIATLRREAGLGAPVALMTPR
jgi:catechol 2,3-dioxygenase-like lactoylglutathione lyase family enzyme